MFVNEIDEQHKRLFQMIEDFHKALKKTNDTKPSLKIISEMKRYAQYHFATEDNYMKKYDYPRIKSHPIRHQEFVSEVTKLEKKIIAGKLIMPSVIVKYLNDWIKNHIKLEDKAYVNYFKSNNLI